MPHVTFTPNLQRHIDVPPGQVQGETVREVLDAVFATRPEARGYVLDDQGAVRQHVVVFVDGSPIQDRVRLGDAVTARSDIYVMQALSGG